MPLPVPKKFDLPDDYLTEVGRIAIEWAHLEHKLEKTIWELLRLRIFYDAEAITTHIPFRVRMDMIGAYARAKPLDTQQIAEWDKIAAEIDEQHEWRNLVIHHEWSSGSPRKQTIARRSARRKKGVKRTYFEADIDHLKETAADIKEVRHRLEKWIGTL